MAEDARDNSIYFLYLVPRIGVGKVPRAAPLLLEIARRLFAPKLVSSAQNEQCSDATGQIVPGYMSNVRSITTIVLVSVGIMLLCASMLLVRRILRVLPSGSLRRGWCALCTLIALFILGYAAFGLIEFGTAARHIDVIVSFILFFGACFVVIVTKLSERTTKDILRIASLEHDAFVDPLTDLHNRRYFAMRLDGEIARAQRYGFALAALMIDIDHFKRINDAYGHQIGDQVLCRVGEIIKMTVRSSDIACRYGGEEFVVATPETKLAEAGKLAERLRETIGSVSCQRGGQPHLGDCQRRGIHPSRRRRRAIILGSRGPSSLPSESGRSQPR